MTYNVTFTYNSYSVIVTVETESDDSGIITEVAREAFFDETGYQLRMTTLVDFEIEAVY